jgi:glucokinase
MPPIAGSGTGVVIGLDIGGTKTHSAAFDHKLNSRAEFRVRTGIGSSDIVAASVMDTVAKLARQLDGQRIDAIGIGIPGVVDPPTGSVRQAVNLGIASEPLELCDRLESVYGAPCHIDNDVNVAALGAYHLLRDDHKISDLAYLSIGTGIAAGIILRGRMHRGHRGVAGEIGHFPLLPDGPECECGLRGCLEALASGSAIARQWPNATADAGSAEVLIRQANAGDATATAALDPIADYLAKAIYLLAVTYDVDCVVIGGGVADLGVLILDTIKAGLGRLEDRSEFVRSLQLPDRVVLKPAGAVGAIGAALLTDPENRI